MAQAPLQAPSPPTSSSLSRPSPYRKRQQQLKSDPAFEEIFWSVYQQLHSLAAHFRRGEKHCTLSTTEIVSEAYLKLRSSPPAWNDEAHFKRIAARAMRQILVDAAERGNALRRGGGILVQVTLSDALGVIVDCNETMLDLNRFIDELGEFDPRAAEIVEMHCFAGFTVAEIAISQKLSSATVSRDLHAAVSWLKAKMNPGETRPSEKSK